MLNLFANKIFKADIMKLKLAVSVTLIFREVLHLNILGWFQVASFTNRMAEATK